jgi:hypothetical protein
LDEAEPSTPTARPRAIVSFVRDGATTCEATHDERLAFNILAAGLAAVGLVASAFRAFSPRA